MTRPSEAEAWREALEIRDRALVESGVGQVSISTKGDLRDFLAAMVRIARETAALSPPPLPSAEPVAWQAQEAEWFRWLRDNPQAAAYIAVLVAKNRPFGPDLGATMNSDEVVGVMEDENQPEYRYTTPPAAAQDTECVWAQDGWGGEGDREWSTSCGNCFTINDGTPSENGMKFCLYCGGKVSQEEYKSDDDADAARAAGGES